MSRAPLSIIIPTLNSAGALPLTLESLYPALRIGLARELIISDGGSTDNIDRFSEELGAVLVTGPPGRGRQLASGAEAAEGEWLLFLHSDTALEIGWIDVVFEHIAHRETAGYFRLKFRASGIAPLLVAAWANFRSARFGLPYGDQGLLISRRLYDAIGGFKSMPIMEDVDIARRLKGRLERLDAVAVTDAGRYQREGWLRRGTRNLFCIIQYFRGVKPERILRSYLR
ncbi:MAG: TIGR04283 family arsenosugar biosynthesis glycosyltransferase [Rhodobacteraceae bacterium]|nr:TIGR04283 family arsenosugar biosynthesis glycosyltransferase [Paracoccaceae bacterium]